MWMLIGLYLLLINCYAFFIMKHDKRQAKQGGRRIPEKRLFIVAGIGGAVGVFCGMRAYRHKTKHASFRLGIPLILLLQMMLVIYIILKFSPENLDFLM